MTPIALVDDHEIFRSTLRVFLENTGIFSVVMEASNGQEFFKHLDSMTQKPSIVLTDFQMKIMNGKEIATKLRKRYPDIRILCLTAFNHTHLVGELFKAGVDGLVEKGSSVNSLQNAITDVLKGRKVFYDAHGKSLPLTKVDKRKLEATPQLSNKEIIFLKMCTVQELSYKMMADKLKLSPKTIDRYRENLFKKLNVRSRVGLVIYALQNGIAEVNCLAEDFRELIK